MMRSSSMLVTRARSVRNICKVPFKFRFELHADSVDRVVGSGDVVLVWFRPNRSLSSSPARLDVANRRAAFESTPLSTEITLFKTTATDRTFHDKVMKLYLKAGSADGKTIAKLHLNLAEYAEVPFARRRISAEMDGGPVLLATIACTFLMTGKAATSLRGPVLSATDSSLALSSDEENPENASEFSTVSPPSEGAHANFLKDKLKVKRSPSKDGRKGKDSDTGADSFEAALEKANKENARLKKQIEEAEKSRDSGALQENQTLKRELDDLKVAIAREPVYSDVVRELKEAKMALAMVQLEKEKIAQALTKVQMRTPRAR